MSEIFALIRSSWDRIKHRIIADPDELARRLARRRSATLTRPPRAFCLAVRASDARLVVACTIDPRKGIEHEVRLDADGLREVCAPIYLAWPGESARDVAKRLGVSSTSLTTARLRGRFRTDYIPPIAGRGKPVPRLACDDALDPTGPLLRMPDAAWGHMPRTLVNYIPDEFEQVVTRVPMFRAVSDIHRRAGATHPEVIDPIEPRGPSRRLPPPPPDYVWYKWKDGQYVGDAITRKLDARRARDRKSAKARRQRRTPASRSMGSMRQIGWAWRCPGCGRNVRKLYLPMPIMRPDIEWDLPLPLVRSLGGQVNEIPAPLAALACVRCHNVAGFSSVDRNSWNSLVAYFSGGLLYGREVPRPAWFTATRKRAYRPQARRAPSARAEQLLPRLLAGDTFVQIALELGISWGTVHSYAKRVYKQHGVTNRLGLARLLGSSSRQPTQPHPRKRAQVQRRLLAGQIYKTIAREMGISYCAVHNHAKLIYRQHNVQGRKGLMRKLGVQIGVHPRSLRGESATSAVPNVC